LEGFSGKSSTFCGELKEAKALILLKGGRLLNAIGFGMVFIISPVWIGENVRPEVRGFFLCLVNGSIVLGQFILS
jgi:hypothetical protein